MIEYYAESFRDDIPASYAYIDVKYTGIDDYPDVIESLQVLIYKDLIRNTETKINPERLISFQEFIRLSEKIYGLDLDMDPTLVDEDILLTQESFGKIQRYIDTLMQEEQKVQAMPSRQYNIGSKQDIFYDVYRTLEREHYRKDSFSKDSLTQGAIKGITEATQDDYTTYFPPVEGDSFIQSLDGEYEGIGAYVDLPEP